MLALPKFQFYHELRVKHGARHESTGLAGNVSEIALLICIFQYTMRKTPRALHEGALKKGPNFSTPLESIQSPRGRQLQVLREGSKSSPDLHRSLRRCNI